MDKKQILIVDDDPAILRLLSTNLKARGYEVITSTNGEECLEAVQKDFVDLMILDLMMPKVDGVEVCRRVREWSDVPIIILSARGDENDKVKCLDLGADDYLTKPFHHEELLARVNALLRRAAGHASPTIEHHGIRLNTAEQRVSLHGADIELTGHEYRVIEYLMSHAGKVVSKTELTEHIYDQDFDRDSNVLEVFVGRLRKKLDPDGSLKPIETLRGRGYRFRGGDA